MVAGLSVTGQPYGGLKAVGHIDFLKQVVDVGFYGVGADTQAISDLFIAAAPGDHIQNRLFAPR